MFPVSFATCQIRLFAVQCKWLDNENGIAARIISAEGWPTWHCVEFRISQRH